MKTLIEQLRNAAKAQPINAVLFNEAANHLEASDKIKANTVRTLIEYLKECRPHFHLSAECEVAEKYANNLERGAL
jgi:hypothetical protein